MMEPANTLSNDLSFEDAVCYNAYHFLPAEDQLSGRLVNKEWKKKIECLLILFKIKPYPGIDSQKLKIIVALSLVPQTEEPNLIKCCSELTNVVHYNRKYGNYIAERGGDGIIIDLMKRPHNNENVLAKVADTFSTLIRTRKRSYNLKKEIIDFLVKNMKCFPNIPSLLTVTYEALKISIISGDTSKNYIVENNLTECIVKSLKHFADQDRMLMAAMDLLIELATDDRLANDIREKEGIECIIGLMKKCLLFPAFLDKANNLLYLLALKNDENRRYIRKNGGVERIVKLLEIFKRQYQVFKYAYFALGALAIDDDNKIYIREKGGIKHIMSTMQFLLAPGLKHADSLTSGAYALLNLLKHSEDNKAFIKDNGGVALLSNLKNSVPSATYADEALAILSAN